MCDILDPRFKTQILKPSYDKLDLSTSYKKIEVDVNNWSCSKNNIQASIRRVLLLIIQKHHGDLACLTCDFLRFPITAVASESAFNIGGQMLTPYQNRLIPKEYASITFRY